MSCEGNDRVEPPPELNYTLPKLRQIKNIPRDWLSDEIQSQLPTDILLITANDHEFIACYSYMKQIKRGYCMTLGMVDFGEFGDQDNQKVRVALMKRARGPSDTQTAVINAAGILYPKVALFVGICGTMKPKKAKLGDVVISSKLGTYDDKKVMEDGTDQYHGTKVDVSKNMGHLILHAADGWEPPLKDPNSLEVEVHREALMLSGPEFVNNLKRREELLNYFRDALGLEMEGAGLYAAAYNLQMEWAVIKGVSDYADGSNDKTKTWQPFASVMAASVVHHMFKYHIVTRDWPNYNEKQN